MLEQQSDKVIESSGKGVANAAEYFRSEMQSDKLQSPGSNESQRDKSSNLTDKHLPMMNITDDHKKEKEQSKDQGGALTNDEKEHRTEHCQKGRIAASADSILGKNKSVDNPNESNYLRGADGIGGVGDHKLPTGDRLVRDKDGKETLTTPNGDKLTVNSNGSYDVKGNVKSITSSSDGSEKTVTFGDGSVAIFSNNGIRQVSRNEQTANFITPQVPKIDNVPLPMHQPDDWRRRMQLNKA